MKNFRILIIVASLIVLALVISMALGIVSISLTLPKSEVSKKIKTLFELANPGMSIEIAALSEESGLYKTLLKTVGPAGTNYIEVYVTKDGKLLTQNIIFIEQSIEQIKRLRDFVECLHGKGVRIFGLSNQTATLLQLNILGVYSTKLFVPCDGDLVRNCIAANVTEVPSVVFGGRVEPGIKAIQWFESATGCKY